MKVVKPIDLKNNIVIDYTQTSSPDALLSEWDPLKSDYVFKDEVKVSADKKKYKLAAQTSNPGLIPKDNPSIWIASPFVELAMFEYNNDYATTLSSNFVATIPSAYILDTLYFQNIDGDTISITLLDSNDDELQIMSEDIYDWDIDSFGKYLWPDDPILKTKIQFDFIDLNTEKIKIEILGSSISCGFAVAGYKEDLGMSLRDGISYNQNNFYASTRDAWGNLIDSKLRIIEDVSIPVADYNDDIDKNVNKIAQLYGTPHLFIADDRDKEKVQFKFINIFGNITSNSVTPAGGRTDKILKIEGK